MKYDPQNHHRQTIRLPGYDYTHSGAYFVTIVAWQREFLFGEIIDGKMHLNPIGQIVEKEWRRLSQRFENLVLDEFSTMPNHIHGIVILSGIDIHKDDSTHAREPDSSPHVESGSLASIMRSYKSSTILRFNRTRWARSTPFWQRNYYEHIVRHEDDLNRIRQYIQDYPINWATDEENHEDQL